MRKSKTFLTVISFILFLPALSFALTPYDDFSGASIDKTKWRQGDWVREIDSANQRLSMRHASPSPAAIPAYPYWDANSLSFVEPSSVSSMQVDVTILEANITNQAKTQARLTGVWYNDGTLGGGRIGDIVAEVFLRKDSTGLYAAWSVVKLTNTDGTAASGLGYEEFTTEISAGTTYTLYVSYNSGVNQFTFRVNEEEKTFGPDDLPPPEGDASSPRRLFGTRVDVTDSASSGYISAAFDNVYKNEDTLPYEDFSSSAIDQTKWNDYEFIREISAGKLRSKTRSSTSSSSALNNFLELRNPLTIHTLQAKVTPVDFQNSQGALQLGSISGTFYNDGTSGQGLIGDVVGEVFIGGNGANPVAGWRVYTYTNADGTTATGLASGEFDTPVILGNTYTLFLAWNGKKLTLKCENEVADYTPVTSINQVKVPFKRIRTAIIQASNLEATIETLFDDVMTGPMPYDDDFSGAYIDITRWKDTEFVREIDTGSNKLLLKHASPNPVVTTSFPYTTFNDLPFLDPDTVNSIQADVAVLQSDVRNYSHTRARLAGRWYNDGSGTPGTDMTGDIFAEVALWGTSTGLSARWVVARMTNASGNATTLGTGVFDTSVTTGTSYNLFIDYDSGANQFTFQIGADVVTFGPTGLPAYVRGPNSPWKSVSTRVQINTDASSAYIVATFDNVYKNGAEYDVFSAPTIDQTKWNAYEFVREISEGKLRSKVRTSTASTSTIFGGPQFLDPSSINVIQAKVTPTIYQNEQGANATARITGFFYNDGTPGGGCLGVVGAQVQIGGTGENPIGSWTVWTFSDYEGNNPVDIASGTFTAPITLGNTYTLFLGWDGSQFTFKMDNESASYIPVTSILPPNILYREIGSRIFNPAGKEATIEALFDDVIVNPRRGIIDFDGDRKSDIAVWRPEEGVWWIIRSSDGGWMMTQWGVSSDVPVPGDYDGDGKADIAVWRPEEGVWWIIRSSDGGWMMTQWGVSSDVPVSGDYDGDGKTDIAVWRPGDGVWYIIRSSDGGWTVTQWGVSSDVPVPGDYDGDGKTDIAVWRPGDGVWWIIRSSDGGWMMTQWGVDALNDEPISQ